MYNVKYIKTKIKLYNTNFYGNKTPIENGCSAWFSVILLDSIIDVNKKCYPQIFLKRMQICNKKEKDKEYNYWRIKKSVESDDDE